MRADNSGGDSTLLSELIPLDVIQLFYPSLSENASSEKPLIHVSRRETNAINFESIIRESISQIDKCSLIEARHNLTAIYDKAVGIINHFTIQNRPLSLVGYFNEESFNADSYLEENIKLFGRLNIKRNLRY